MAVYDFQKGVKKDGERRTVRVPMHRIEELQRRAARIGWYRVYTPPAGLIIYPGYHEAEAESHREADRLDRQGWPGVGEE